MKYGKFLSVVSIFGIALLVQPHIGYASRPLGVTVTGEITASPKSSEIEVGHKAYHIKVNSSAAKSVRGFSLGQIVDLILDVPGTRGPPEVLVIAAHST